jgi:hypothetical protein
VCTRFAPTGISSLWQCEIIPSSKRKRRGNITPEQIQQALTEAGWVLDGSFYEHLIGGHDDHASIIAHSWVWEQDTHVFQLSDERTERVYWVHTVPTPWQAKLLLDEHDGPPEVESQRRNLYELGQHGYASS